MQHKRHFVSPIATVHSTPEFYYCGWSFWRLPAEFRTFWEKSVAISRGVFSWYTQSVVLVCSFHVCTLNFWALCFLPTGLKSSQPVEKSELRLGVCECCFPSRVYSWLLPSDAEKGSGHPPDFHKWRSPETDGRFKVTVLLFVMTQSIDNSCQGQWINVKVRLSACLRGCVSAKSFGQRNKGKWAWRQ